MSSHWPRSMNLFWIFDSSSFSCSLFSEWAHAQKNYANENLYRKRKNRESVSLVLLTYQIVSRQNKRNMWRKKTERMTNDRHLGIICNRRCWEKKMQEKMMMILTGCKMILYLFDCKSISCGEFYYLIEEEELSGIICLLHTHFWRCWIIMSANIWCLHIS